MPAAARSLLLIVVCLGMTSIGRGDDESIIQTWTFDDDTTQGWNPLTQVELTANRGVLRVKGTGDDPHFSGPASGAAGWKKLTLRARFNGRRNGQVFWMTADHPATDESRSAPLNMRSRSDGWEEFSVYFKPESSLTGIRIDPDRRATQIEIDSIALANEEPEADVATDPAGFTLPEGFQAELLYSVPAHEEGSWVSLCVDPDGRLYVCDQYGGLYRVTPGTDENLVEAFDLTVDDNPFGGAQGMVWAFDSLYCVVNSHLGIGPGLYRIRDTNNDDLLDDVELLTALPTTRLGVEHGPHGIVLSPDGQSLCIVGGNMTPLPDDLAISRPTGWNEDQLLPRMPASNGHASGLLAPGGWVCRVSPDGSEWELICNGFRNPYDIAFHRTGELFAYDADMEMDIGTPWYRPTRVCHVVSGGEFGWRFGTGKWPAYFPDSLPPVVDVGLGSPTGVAFGYGARFPKRYEEALYICDWTHGRMFAVHLQPARATFRGELEEFLTGTPLPLTDITINPHDGAMYFTIGGRRTQSGLYRVTYTGDVDDSVDEDHAGTPYDLVQPMHRHVMEDGHVAPDPSALAYLFDEMNSPDRHMRFAARVAVEHLPVELWAERALAENRPDAAIQSLLALARMGDESFAMPQLEAGRRLNKRNNLSPRQRTDLTRVLGLVFIRHLSDDTAIQAELALELEQHFPAANRNLNHELCRLLVYLGSEHVVGPALDLAERANTQEDRLHYQMCLRVADAGWTPELRERYFTLLNDSETKAATADYIGGGHLQIYVQMFRNDAVERLSDDERESLASIIDAPIESSAPSGSPTPRPFVRNWTVDDLTAELDRVGEGRSFQNGKRMFAVANCLRCHRFGTSGGIFGPDITRASQRYSRQVMLRELITPSKQVSDQYEAHQILTNDGRVYTGRILNDDGELLTLATDPLQPAHIIEIPRGEIDDMAPSQVSLMPAGLLNTLTREDIFDLLAYIESAGDPEHAAFRSE